METEVRVIQVLGSIKFNKEELKKHVEGIALEYKGSVFGDDSIDVAKKVIASLRKEREKIDTRRKEVKKEYSKPITDFEDDVKEVLKIFDDVIFGIDDQVKGFEERQKEIKKESIVELWGVKVAAFSDYIKLEQVYNPKWENKTYLLSNIEKEIDELVEEIVNSIETIKGMNSEYTDIGLEQFKKSHSLTDAISTINRYEQQKQDIINRQDRENEERLKREEKEKEERIRQEEREKILKEQQATYELEEAKQTIRTEVVEELLSVKQKEPEETFGGFDADEEKAIFTVFGSKEEIEQVELYLNSIGLTYGMEK